MIYPDPANECLCELYDGEDYCAFCKDTVVVTMKTNPYDWVLTFSTKLNSTTHCLKLTTKTYNVAAPGIATLTMSLVAARAMYREYLGKGAIPQPPEYKD